MKNSSVFVRFTYFVAKAFKYDKELVYFSKCQGKKEYI